ncbi:hypothetical protein GSI_00187 [Ganoderma sinense ZZ0214-1]|uniref:Phosphatidylglycerol/phosphatidylinositol transfer protein n=1 Tax=Ganoderma sinense ZZ0214-1 TaxID=1077348 RepID=A0A2G8SSE9_9APHY|nr:hypothetical protein GSI_00187 [Ganoderma sinense ZZ0214-1]
MFTKTTLFKFALVPLAAATVLSDSASATPATQLEVRGDAPDPSGGGKWSNKANCECAWDKDHVPEIVKPCKETVWRVGERQKVVWEKKGDDDWKHDEPKKHNGTDGKDWGYGEDEDKDKDGKDWDDGKDHKRRPCKTRLFLRKGEAKPFVILAENFDVKAGFVEVTVPNVFHGEDYRVTLVLARDDRPELESCSDKFKIVKDEKYWHKDCKDECKPEDGKDKDGKDGGY